MQVTSYQVDKQFVKMTKFGFWAFTCFAAISVIAAFIPEGDGTVNLAIMFLMIFCALVFGTFALLAFFTIKSFPKYAISFDHDGVWYASCPRAQALVLWEDIRKIEEKSITQKLSLFDVNGGKLIDVHYQLTNFEELRDAIANHVIDNYSEINNPIFRKGLVHHLFNIIGITGFTYFAIYGLRNSSEFIFFIGMAVSLMGLYEYCTGYYKIFIDGDHIVAKSLLKNMRYNITDISNIAMHDESNKGSRIPNVRVYIRDGSMLKLPSMGHSVFEIYIILKSILNKKRY